MADKPVPKKQPETVTEEMLKELLGSKVLGKKTGGTFDTSALENFLNDHPDFDVNAAIDNRDNTILCKAIDSWNIPATELLVKRGADANLKSPLESKWSNFPLEKACGAARAKDPAEVVKMLEILVGEGKANVSDLYHCEFTAVTKLITDGYNNYEAIDYLLTACDNAIIEQTVRNYNYNSNMFEKGNLFLNTATPLHIAAGCQSVGAICALLDHGANANAKNSDGKTPAEVVLARHDQHCRVLHALLKRYEADERPSGKAKDLFDELDAKVQEALK